MNNMIVLTSFYGKIEEKFQWIYSDYFACIFFSLCLLDITKEKNITITTGTIKISADSAIKQKLQWASKIWMLYLKRSNVSYN